MSQQSSLTQSAHSVRQVLTAYTFPKVPLWVDAVLWLGLIKDTAARFEYGTCEECDLAAEEFSHKH